MAGHLFGYEAARAIDALADPLRRVRAAVVEGDSLGASGTTAVASPEIREQLSKVDGGLGAGLYDGCLEASTAIRLATVVRFVTGAFPPGRYTNADGQEVSPDVLVDDLIDALTKAISELTRPIDAIKHQAKTVTVGISRSDEGLMGNRLVADLVALGASRDRLSYRTIKTVADLEPAVAAVRGSTRYRITGNVERDGATIEVVDRTGIALTFPSRVGCCPDLRGTKRRVAIDREPLVARGRVDGRVVLLVPEVKGGAVVGMTLLHIELVDHLPADVVRGVLQGYRGRYDVLRDWVTETESTFREERLGELGVIDLLTAPLTALADEW
jgi:glucosamine--fructose-6-phosphate aminotransferase (isomerizing)